MSRSKLNRKGEIHISNKGEKLTIIEYIDKNNITIQFNDETIIYNIQYVNIKLGKVSNPNFPSVYNIGFIGIGKYLQVTHKEIYKTWHSMLRRCYCEKFLLNNTSYLNSLVDEKWHNFQVFAEWYEQNYIDGFQLDKDILFKGNKIYGKDTCCFVPQEINTLFTKSTKVRGNLPIGVRQIGNKFSVQLNKYGQQFSYGGFITIKEAFDCYKVQKESYIKYVANLRKDKIPDIVYQAMINYKVEITD